MVQVLAAVVKDLRRYSRDPLALTMWIGIPVVIGSLMVLVLGGGEGPAPRVHLLVADEDDSFGSRMLLGMLNQERLEIIRSESVDEETGRRKLDRGEASALLVIPEGFAEAVLKEEPTQLELVTNPAERISPRLVKELLGLLREAVFYAHRLFGPEIRQMAAGPVDGERLFRDAAVAKTSIAINQTFTRLDRYLNPPVIELKFETPEENPSEESSADALPFSFYFVPGMLLMGLLFAGQGLSDDIWRERETSTLRRVMTTPLGMSRFLIGKIVAGAAVFGLIALVALVGGFWYFELPWPRFPLAWVWSVGAGILFFGLMLPVQVFASSHRGASVLGYLVVFPLMMLGGSMFPFEMMPDWLARVGRITPNGWAVEQLKAILLAKNGPLPLGTAFAVLLLVSICLFAVGGFRIARVFARS